MHFLELILYLIIVYSVNLWHCMFLNTCHMCGFNDKKMKNILNIPL